MSWYASRGQDRALVEELLPTSGIIEPGYAVDVGANDGVFFSNTAHLERERGWEVLCVEANPLYVEDGTLSRKRWLNVACGEKNEESREFHAYRDEAGSLGAHSALVLESGGVPYHDLVSGQPPAKTFYVLVRTLDTLLDEAKFPRLDLVSIDVEGYEAEVLAGLSLDRWKPTFLIIEGFRGIVPTPRGYRFERLIEYDYFFRREPV